MIWRTYFNSQPHKEADYWSGYCPGRISYFNSQPHKEADKQLEVPTQDVEHFNSQPHKEADHRGAWKTDGMRYFNSQPHKEADRNSTPYLRCIVHFNSQPHKEADHTPPDLPCNGFISTHSLTRRLTATPCLSWLVSVFQLTASQGGWQLLADLEEDEKEFQLTASQGGWPGLSIVYHLFRYFNSQPHKEADGSNSNSVNVLWFQLTASQGGWRKHFWTSIRDYIFQLTASQGGWPVSALRCNSQ